MADKIHLLVVDRNGKSLAEMETPAAPDVGERVIIARDTRVWKVDRRSWRLDPESDLVKCICFTDEA